jgi:hypothetical protein
MLVGETTNLTVASGDFLGSTYFGTCVRCIINTIEGSRALLIAFLEIKVGKCDLLYFYIEASLNILVIFPLFLQLTS